MKTLLTFTLLVVLFKSSLLASEPFGIALSLEGEVYVTRGIIELEAKIEETFYFEDDIETGEDGSVQISFNSSFLSIGPNTSVSLYREKGEKGEDLIIISLDEGKFRSKINDLELNQFFEVHTDRGNLRVHGTDFVTSYSPESGDKFGVSVLQGSVGITENNESDEEPDSETSSTESPAETDSSNNDNETTFNNSQEEEIDDDNPQITIIENNQADDIKPTFIYSNQASGFSEAGAEELSNLSSNDVESLKSQFPIPGDDEEEPLFFSDLGIKDVRIDEIATVFSEEASEVLEITQPTATNPVSEEVANINDQSNSGFRINFTIDTTR